MKLTVQQVVDAFLALAMIVAAGRPMPQKGKYRVARMHAKLRGEFEIASKARDELISSYGFKKKVSEPGPDGKAVTRKVDAVPDNKADEFAARWKEIADQEIDVEVEPIPLSQIDMGDQVDGALSVQQLIALGPLVVD